MFGNMAPKRHIYFVGCKRIPDAIVHTMSNSKGDFFQIRLFLRETLFTSHLGPETPLMRPGVIPSTCRETRTVSTNEHNCRQKGEETGPKGDSAGITDQKAGNSMLGKRNDILLEDSLIPLSTVVPMVLMTPQRWLSALK